MSNHCRSDNFSAHCASGLCKSSKSSRQHLTAVFARQPERGRKPRVSSVRGRNECSAPQQGRRTARAPQDEPLLGAKQLLFPPGPGAGHGSPPPPPLPRGGVDVCSGVCLLSESMSHLLHGNFVKHVQRDKRQACLLQCGLRPEWGCRWQGIQRLSISMQRPCIHAAWQPMIHQRMQLVATGIADASLPNALKPLHAAKFKLLTSSSNESACFLKHFPWSSSEGP